MADFGARLREARERKGISLRQIAAATKISVAALERLERNDVSKLPGGIFSRAFVRSYAVEVGLDPDETVKQFLQEFAADPSVGPALAAGVASADAQRAGIQVPRAVSAGGEMSEEVDFESKQRMAGVVLKLVLVSLPLAIAIVYFSTRPGSPVTGESLPRVTATGGAPPGEPTEPATEAVERAPEQGPPPAEPGPPAQPASATESAATPARMAASEQAVTVEIVPTADCWAKLTADGQLALSRIVVAGERASARFTESAVLVVGNAAACGLVINGQAARPLGREGQVREIRLTRDNFRSFLP